jgi:putative Holliday junction resolvase
MMRALGLDVGEARTGLAEGDTGVGIAVPVGALERTGTDADHADAALAEAARRGAEVLVVGMPLSMTGRPGPQAERVTAFIALLRERGAFPVETVDERLSTVEAGRRMQEGSGGARGPKGHRSKRTQGAGRERGALDAAAAAVLLQSWLDRRR